ncbi:MAG: hypothetical protein ACYS0H_30875, partial [Planctomycetota bacterium]
LFTFRGGTVIPANGTIYLAANRIAFRSRDAATRGGPVKFIVGDFTGRLAPQDETLHLTNRQQVTVASITTTLTGRR